MRHSNGKLAQSVTLVAFLGISAMASAQTATGDDTRPAQVEIQARAIPEGAQCTYIRVDKLQVSMKDGLPVVNGEVGGSNFPMVVDTGSKFTKLGMQQAERMRLNLHHMAQTETDPSGKELQAYSAYVNGLRLGRYGRHRMAIEVTQMPGQNDFAVGADVLLNTYQRDVEISLANHEIKFFAPKNCDDSFLGYWDDNASVIPVSDLADGDPRQIVTVQVDGHEMTAMIDSGSPHSILDVNAARRIGIYPMTVGVFQARFDGTVHHQAPQMQVLLRRFAIGDETIEHPSIAIADLWGWLPASARWEQLELETQMWVAANSMNWLPSAPSNEFTFEPPDMILGADFLRAHRVLLALSQRKMYFSYVGGRVFGGSTPIVGAPQS
ncbi:MAG TPA: pepsin/retropepsin-like aspartic protease family protein [Burkholderiaceae bacterium]